MAMSSNVKDRLSQHVVDLAALFIKLHDYHWHVRGPQFKVLHELTETYYDDINEQFDAIAERLVQLGGVAPASVRSYASNTAISDAGKNAYTAEDVLSGIIKDFEYLLAEYKQTRRVASETDDPATDNMLADYIGDLEKKIWMLKATKG
jgi:starvation-inducible DNA-binding protein